MKFYAGLLAIVTVASAIPLRLSIPDYSQAVETTVTLAQLTAALHNPNTNPAVIPYLESALHELTVAMNNGQEEDTITLSIPAMQESTWTLQQLSDAIQNPDTDPELKIYLEYALNQLMDSLFSGTQVVAITVVTPPGVIAVAPELNPVQPVVAVPEPVIVVPEAEVAAPEPVVAAPEPVVAVPEPVVVVPEPVVLPETPSPDIVAPEVSEPAAPTPAETEADTPAASSAPLVQIIINVNAAGQVVGTPVLVPQEVHNDADWSPVAVIEQAPETVAVVEQVPETVAVVEQIPETVAVVEQVPETVAVVEQVPETVAVVEQVPETVAVVEQVPEIVGVVEQVPETVGVVEQPGSINPIDVIAVAAPEPNPIDVIAVSPPEINPIDVIAVAAPEVNPIDILSPLPVVVASNTDEGIKV